MTKVNWFAFACLSFLLPFVARAEVVVDETKSGLLQFSDVDGWACTPGQSSGFKTFSSFEISIPQSILNDSSIPSIGAQDPQHRVGDHCDDLQSEFGAAFPATMTIHRTVDRHAGWNNGQCIEGLYENIDATVGTFHLIGAGYTALDQVDNSNCTP